MIRRVAALIAAGMLGSLLVTTASSAAVPAAAPSAAGQGAGASGLFPNVIHLPDGWQPEGIAIAGHFAYFGSLATGSIYRADLVTGRGAVVSTGPGTPSVGLKVDRAGRLFVAGGPAGDARVVDARTGAVLASYRLHAAPSFINDVVLTPDAAWFTDSVNPLLYKLPLRHGSLPTQAQVVALPLTGNIVYTPGFNANGIARTPDGRGLLIVQTSTGLLFRVDPATGVARTVDLGGYLLTNGDGLLVRARTLYAVQNVLNTVAVFRLNRSGTRGTLVDRLTDPRLDVPTTVAAFGNRLYLPNARFTTPPTPTTTYTAVAIPA
ncbi:MAG: SMP-30/gluconolactonase/LRE family protein [Catenulispora sp.]